MVQKVDSNTSFLNNQYNQLKKEISKQHVFSSFVTNPGYIKPEPAQGYLLKRRNLLSSAAVCTKDVAKDTLELAKATRTGKSNDNALGRLNDLGLKLGGAGIAAYLFAKKGSKTKNLMEIVGPMTFFTSMAVWPRLLIADPIKRRFGFDIHQKYIDSQGRKKSFFQDNQYLPWSIWPEEDIDKIGDKMGVKKDIPERRELIKEKMRATALQGNTLWMLTAGFSPLMTSLVCNRLEKGVTAAVINHNAAKALEKVNDMPRALSTMLDDPNFDKAAKNELKELTKRYKEAGIAPDEAYFEKAAELLNPTRLLLASKDVDDAKITANLPNYKQGIIENLKKAYSQACQKDNKEIVMNFDDFVEQLKDLKTKDSLGNGIDLKETIIPAFEKIATTTKEGAKTIDCTAAIGELQRLSRDEGIKVDRSIARPLEKSIHKIIETQAQKPANIAGYLDDVQKLYEISTRPITARLKLYADTVNPLVGQKYESVYTKDYLKSAEVFMDELKAGMNPEVWGYDKLRGSKDLCGKYLQESLSAKVACKNGTYAEFIKKITDAQEGFESAKVTKAAQDAKDYTVKSFHEFFKATGENFADVETLKAMDKAGKKGKLSSAFNFFESIMTNGKGKNANASVLDEAIDLFTQTSRTSVAASSHRLVLAADLEKRIESGLLQKQWKQLGGSEENFAEVVKKCRQIMYDTTMNDVSNTFHINENKKTTRQILKLLFGSDFAPETVENANTAVMSAITETKKGIAEVINSVDDLARPGASKVEGFANAAKMGVTPKGRYFKIGLAPSDLIMQNASKAFNDKHWMKLFGGIAIGVAAVTLITQHFFGKVKNEELYQKGGIKKEGVQNAK